jgi:hypothetical protein
MASIRNRTYWVELHIEWDRENARRLALKEAEFEGEMNG